jgi:hypothetical protein
MSVFRSGISKGKVDAPSIFPSFPTLSRRTKSSELRMWQKKSASKAEMILFSFLLREAVVIHAFLRCHTVSIR